MKTFVVKFKDAPELICQLNDTFLANRYYELLKQQYTDDSNPIFRDQQKYTMEYFIELVNRAQTILGWDWHRETYDLSDTTILHKDIENYLAQGFANIPEEHDDILHELHFSLHAIESGSRRDNWLQIEWFNDRGFYIADDEYPAKRNLDFGDLRLQNPYVGHHPLYVYEQKDFYNVMQTCKFHDYCKPGINIVINNCELLNASNKLVFDEERYKNWFETYAPEFVTMHGIERILKFTGHPIVGKVLNLADLRTVVNTTVLEFESLAF